RRDHGDRLAQPAGLQRLQADPGRPPVLRGGNPPARRAGRRDAAGAAVARRSVIDDYVARIARDYDGERPLKVAWDVANGAAGEVMERLVKRLPGRHVLLNQTIDGTFPAHHPDPTVPENLVELQQTVIAEGCDLGIAFDGDGDRIGVVDARGRIF